MNTWSFITLMLAALAIAAPFAHVLEMPVRRAYDPALYVTITHTLYMYFGIVGGAIEVGATLAAVVWAMLVAASRTASSAARRWALAGAACPILAHALFWLLVAPVNAEFAVWTPEEVPPDWTRLRDQWEFTHAVRAALFFLGFCALLASVFAARAARAVPDESREAVPVGPHRGETTR
jgi:hypothetical protein